MIKKPLVNKNTFEFHVVANAQQLASRPGIRKHDPAFPEAELAIVKALRQRVSDLAATFKIDDPKARPADLNLERNWIFYDDGNLAHLSQEYAVHASYFVRAYHELVGIAVATARSFLTLMEPPPSLGHAPNMQCPGTDLKGRSVIWIAQVKTAGESYHHTRLEYTSRAFLKSLYRERGEIFNGALLGDIHETIIDATKIMSTAVTVAEIYSTKRWVVCKD